MFTFKIYSSMVDFDPNVGIRIATAIQEIISAFMAHPEPSKIKTLKDAALKIHIVGHKLSPDRYWQTEVLLELESSSFGTRSLKFFHYSYELPMAAGSFLSDKEDRPKRVPPHELFHDLFESLKPQPVQ